MILQQLETLWPKRPTIQVGKMIVRQRRQLKRVTIRTQRRVLSWLKIQYYLASALSDGRVAFMQNEDIALASIIITAVVSFGAISILSNALYMFVLAGSVLSTLSGANLALLIIIACAVIGVLCLWVSSLLQNSLSIALIEGSTRKRNRSLRLTLRRSLRHASSSAMAWAALFVAAFGPVAAGLLTILILTHIAHISLAATLPYIAGAAIIGTAWSLWVLANYTLIPYVKLFEQPTSWQATFARSKNLVRRKGKLFILCGYLAFTVCLGSLYGFAVGVEKLTHFNSTLTFLLASMTAVSLANAVLTMLYRKRKLARK